VAIDTEACYSLVGATKERRMACISYMRQVGADLRALPNIRVWPLGTALDPDTQYSGLRLADFRNATDAELMLRALATELRSDSIFAFHGANSDGHYMQCAFRSEQILDTAYDERLRLLAKFALGRTRTATAQPPKVNTQTLEFGVNDAFSLRTLVWAIAQEDLRPDERHDSYADTAVTYYFARASLELRRRGLHCRSWKTYTHRRYGPEFFELATVADEHHHERMRQMVAASTPVQPEEVERLHRIEAAIHQATLDFAQHLVWHAFPLPPGARFEPPPHP